MNLTFRIHWSKFSPEDAAAFQTDLKTRLWPQELEWFSRIEPGAEYYEAPEDSAPLRNMHYTFLSALAGDYARRFRTMDAVIRGYVDADLYAPTKSFLIRISSGVMHDMSMDTLL